MKKSMIFFMKLIKRSNKNELILLSNALAYRLIIAIFPFIIFLMTLMGFFNIQIGKFIVGFSEQLPIEVMQIFNTFMKEVVSNKSTSLLSSSLIISIFSASSGFNSAIKGLNKAYEQKETRGYIKVRIISVLLVLIFAALIIGSLLIFIFGDLIINFVIKNSIIDHIPNIISSFTTFIISICVLFTMIIVIYKIAICKKVSFIELVPGTIVTVIVWGILSKAFNIYVNNFAKFSKVYGSIGSIFIFFFWMNIISFVFLLGGQINAIISERKK